jgi:uncharacterized protein YfdQ (DUF2303 family)
MIVHNPERQEKVNDQTTKTEADGADLAEGLANSWPMETIHLDHGAIDKLSDLGKQASGLDVVRLDDLGGLGRGLPANAPIGIKKGEAPGTFSVKALIEEYRQFPARKAGTAKALTLDSLIELTNRHKIDDTAIFANTEWRNPSIITVVDYHAVAPEGDPAWLKHRISYTFPLSDPWKEWIEKNGKPMEQSDFAAFIEDHIADLSSPEVGEVTEYESKFGTKIATPAQLIELSRGLQVFAGTKVKNAVTLQSGEAQVVFEETHTDADGKPLKVPGLFILSIAPFFMGDLVRVPVRLRYRVAGGGLVWFFQIYRPDLAITDRLRTDLDIIRKRTELPVFEGTPEA